MWKSSGIVFRLLCAASLLGGSLALSSCAAQKEAKVASIKTANSEIESKSGPTEGGASTERYIRLRPLQNRGLKGLDGNHWAWPGYTAQDILAMIREAKPTVLERFISGPLDPDALVPVDPGSPKMTVAEFLNESMKAGAPGCVITPRVSLEILWGEKCEWNSKFDNCFFAVADNLYNLPVTPPIRTISLDNWGGFSKKWKSNEERDQVISGLLKELKDMGWERIAANYIGGNAQSYGLVNEGAFGVDHETYLPKMKMHSRIRSNESIDSIILYIDFKNPAKAFSELDPDVQATKLYEIAKLQAEGGFTFVWPVLGGKFWDVTKVYTSKESPFGGASLFEVMIDAMNKYNPVATDQGAF